MSIVPQAADFSYPASRAKSTVPPLLLCAPRIAGLLPAHIESPVSMRRDAPDTPSAFTFNDPRLAELSEQNRTALLDAAQNLLTAALDIITQDTRRTDLIRAEHTFNEITFGISQNPPPQKHPLRTQDDWDAYFVAHGMPTQAQFKQECAERKEDLKRLRKNLGNLRDSFGRLSDILS